MPLVESDRRQPLADTTENQGSEVQPQASETLRSETASSAVRQLGHFSIGLNVDADVVLGDRGPEVVLRSGAIILERFPLRSFSDADPTPKRLFTTDSARVTVHTYTGLALEVELTMPGAARFAPWNFAAGSWITFDRDLQDPAKISIMQPGQRSSIRMDAPMRAAA